MSERLNSGKGEVTLPQGNLWYFGCPGLLELQVLFAIRIGVGVEQ